jgi:membrane protease YdiL (CAAX protease family)
LHQEKTLLEYFDRNGKTDQINNRMKKYPLRWYLILTFGISWTGALLLVSSKLLNGQPILKMDGILMFPLMLLGPAFTGIFMTAVCDGKPGISLLFSQLGKFNLPAKWYLVILIPPVLILTVLGTLTFFIGPSFKPNFFAFGILFGIPAGFLEEIGWTGFAYPKLLLKYSNLKAAIILGLFWGLWHLPVIDFLGAASPHGTYLIPFFISFVFLLTGLRVLMGRLYVKTGSIFLTQLFHIVSTGCLAMLGPFGISPKQEVLWYSVYGVAIWFSIFFIYKQTCTTPVVV